MDKVNQPITVINNYVTNGHVIQNVTPVNDGKCRPYQYDDYVFLFQKIVGIMACNEDFKIKHWRVTGLLINMMDRSGRIIVSKETLASKLNHAGTRGVNDIIKDLLKWNVIYRPEETLDDLYLFNQRFVFKGKVRDTFNPYACPEIFPQIASSTRDEWEYSSEDDDNIDKH